MKKFLALLTAVVLMVTMMTSCSKGEETLAAPKSDTIGSWDMSTDQEDVYEKMSMLLGVQGQFFQFNSKECNLELYAHHYKDGKLVNEGLMASYSVGGDGYLYIDYRDSDANDMYQEMTDEDAANIATLTTSMMTNTNEDGTNLQFEVGGYGSVDSMMILLNTDDSWPEESQFDIEYEKEFDLWGINLSGASGAGEIEDTVSATKESWMKGECLIITARFTEEKNTVDGDEDIDEEDMDEEMGEPLPDQPSEEQIQEIMKELEETEAE